ncbi:MAG: hypothetical protein NVS4B11_33080 [Ktedonobacteraceae bacterium]
MASYFLDTSAIIKYYFNEQGHIWMLEHCSPEQENKLYISQAALVEVVASMCRKTREQKITVAQRDNLIETFRQDSQDTYITSLVTVDMYTFAGNLCRLHKLRAYDAVQLACVLSLRDEALVNQAIAPIFVCADLELLEVAVAEGLSIENPNNYA